MLARLLDYIIHFKPHQRFLVGLSASILVSFMVPDTFNFPARSTVAWVAYALTSLLIMWIIITNVHPRELPKISRSEDSNRTVFLILVLVAAVASLVAIVALLNSADENLPASLKPYYMSLVLVAVASSWCLVHTVFVFRYAHLYYGNGLEKGKRPKGLEFPNESEPDYLDFAYFSFVIGMTSQVSDVAVSSKAMRRTALAHGILSFGFNAIIIALTISGISK
ncbi:MULTISPECIES: DUF1345 domain-containing protein [unclassified Spirosoma]|uniref:DUF1345 domain-containing protein n=1 Tax=unclassified Spirosoma TaxID=2621999 RepID=UPI00095B8500|nr:MULTISPECIES: DUF1345 domain-containing protein [unclassified Spirosoma]MBN8822257.1 DUF1345 domain-containing protein [Spirosoma sp.]OJW72701.1 MAG: hypothetical protein BGO59_14965 [Spirosoma sp. 48-14]